MLITVTANPCLDRTAVLSEQLIRGAVHRIQEEFDQPGGGGVNISQAARGAGVDTIAALLANPGASLVRTLSTAGIPCIPVGEGRGTRVNFTVTEPDGTTTHFNARGQAVKPSQVEEFTETILSLCEESKAQWVAISGSLPPDMPASWPTEMTRLLREVNSKVAVDISEEPLQELGRLLSEARPDLIKPNKWELSKLTGTKVSALDDAITAAQELQRRGAAAVLVTMGSAGAVLASAHGAWRAAVPPLPVVSTVGAGDSSLFGYLLGDMQGLDEAGCLQLAVAYGSATTSLPGTTIARRDQVDPSQVAVEQVA